MDWIKSKSTANHEIYILQRNDRKLLTLDFHTSTNSARIEYADTKRVFMIRRAGFLKNRTVLCNEYGVTLAQHANEEPVSFLQSALKLAKNWYLSLPAELSRHPSQTLPELDLVHP